MSATSLVFYSHREKDVNLSPAASRELNQDCLLGDYYSYHDVWHFTSAAALGSSLLFLLNLDEDQRFTAVELIKVF